MKLITYSFIGLFLLLLLSCNKEEVNNVGPDIRFVVGPGLVSSDTTLQVREEISIKVTADKGTSNITLFQYQIDKDGEITTVDSGVNINYLDYERILRKSVADVETWTFMVRDKNLLSDEISITLIKSGEPVYQPVHHNSVILGAQNNQTLPNFYSFEDTSTYFLADAFNNQDIIQLLYYYDEFTGEDNIISSPGANIDESVFPQETTGLTNWETRFTTRFIERTDDISIEEFDECKNDSLILAHNFEFSAGKRKCKNLVANDIFAFVTEDQKEGLIKVINVIGEKEGRVEFELKWRE